MSKTDPVLCVLGALIAVLGLGHLVALASGARRAPQRVLYMK